MVTKETELHVNNSVFQGVSVFDIVLTRRVVVGFRADLKDCTFDTSSAVMFTKSGTRALDLDTPSQIKDWAHRLITWKESKCTHRNTSEYLYSRNLRQPNKTVPCFTSIEEWKSFWLSKPGGSSSVHDPVVLEMLPQ